jgi:hypothetical protein
MIVQTLNMTRTKRATLGVRAYIPLADLPLVFRSGSTMRKPSGAFLQSALSLVL